MDVIKPKKTKEVVVLLPYVGNSVLLQLRDFKEGIIFPGCWAFFGGSIDGSETPKTAAFRELAEELCYNATSLDKISAEMYSDNVFIHAFGFRLMCSVDKLVLKEGVDLGLFSLDEVRKKFLYSQKLKQEFPVADTPYIVNTIEKLFNLDEKN